jgi:hypothetical protein
VKKVNNVKNVHNLMNKGYANNIFANMENDNGCVLPLNLLALITMMRLLLLVPSLSIMGPRGARCSASTSTAGRLRDGYCSQI